jgi:parallel beta-helix repeat protein
MNRRVIYAGITLALGAGLALALPWLLGSRFPVAEAQGPDGYSTYHVAPSCAGVPNPCYTAVQAAVDDADDPSDVIKVAAGIYTGVSARAGVTQVVYISKTVTVRGGYTTDDWGTPDAKTNPTTLDAMGQGRVLYITGDIGPTIEGLRITGGDATGLEGGWWGRDAGGGVYVLTATATLSVCQVTDNDAGSGGGIYVRDSNNATLRDNTILSNEALGVGGGIHLHRSDNATLSGNTIQGNTASGIPAGSGYGGGVYLEDSANATLSGNTVLSNTVFPFDGKSYGGGICLERNDDATLSGNTIQGNAANVGYGGGVYLHDSANGTLSDNTIRGNTAYERFYGSVGGGGVSLGGSANVTLSGNTIQGNTASGEGDSDSNGGGVRMYRSDATLDNNVIADNQAETAGSGVYVSGCTARLRHTTLARNGAITPGEGSGLYVTNSGSDYSMVALTNTVLVSHTVGISVTAGNTATLEGTLWGSGEWANGTDWGGDGEIVTGTVNVWGDPAFVDPDAGDYHIGPGSAAVDAGVDAGVTVDIDGQPRPVGAGYDIGADEYCAVLYLPLILRGP